MSQAWMSAFNIWMNGVQNEEGMEESYIVVDIFTPIIHDSYDRIDKSTSYAALQINI